MSRVVFGARIYVCVARGTEADRCDVTRVVVSSDVSAKEEDALIRRSASVSKTLAKLECRFPVALATARVYLWQGSASLRDLSHCSYRSFA